jgi:hypothetical protein
MAHRRDVVGDFLDIIEGNARRRFGLEQQ